MHKTHETFLVTASLRQEAGALAYMRKCGTP